MKRLSGMFTTILFLSIAIPSLADDSQRFEIQHPYLLMGVGGSQHDGLAGKIAFGAQISKHLDVEFGQIGISNFFATLDIEMPYVSLTAKYRMSEKAALSGKLGITRWETSARRLFSSRTEDDHGINALAGVDFRYELSTHWEFVLSVEYYGTVDAGFDRGNESIVPITVGMKFFF